jgi:hypothetical protein
LRLHPAEGRNGASSYDRRYAGQKRDKTPSIKPLMIALISQKCLPPSAGVLGIKFPTNEFG